MTQALRQERAKLITDMRSIIDAAEGAKRDLTAEERSQYESIESDIDSLDSRIERIEKQEKIERSLTQPVDEHRHVETTSKEQVDYRNADSVRGTEEYRDAFCKVLTHGRDSLSHKEERALAAGSAGAGKELVAPLALANGIITALNEKVFMRKYADLQTLTTATALGNMRVTADPSDAEWTSEIVAAPEDNSMATDRRDVEPYPLKKMIKISEKLVRVTAQDVMQLVIDRLSYKFQLPEEAGFTAGSGTNQPLGVFTANAAGISTGRDIETAGVGAVVGDDLIDISESLPEQYLENARWLVHRNFMKLIRKLKDTSGQYLYQTGLQVGSPSTLCGFPIHRSERAPGTLAAGDYAAVFGNFKYYQIVDALDMRFQILRELFALTGEIGVIGQKETDGAPLLEDAFSRLKIKAA